MYLMKIIFGLTDSLHGTTNSPLAKHIVVALDKSLLNDSLLNGLWIRESAK